MSSNIDGQVALRSCSVKLIHRNKVLGNSFSYLNGPGIHVWMVGFPRVYMEFLNSLTSTDRTNKPNTIQFTYWPKKCRIVIDNCSFYNCLARLIILKNDPIPIFQRLDVDGIASILLVTMWYDTGDISVQFRELSNFTKRFKINLTIDVKSDKFYGSVVYDHHVSYPSYTMVLYDGDHQYWYLQEDL